MSALEFQRTTVARGDSLVSAYRVECKCGAEGAVSSNNSKQSLPPEVIAKKFRQKGWFISRSTAICPDCNGKEEKMEKVTQLPVGGVRQMSPSDRRRVFREVDDAWDEARGRYLGSNTDHAIATKLDVPRAWVEQIRRESFGDSGKNEDFDKLIGNLQNLKGEAERSGAQALDLAQKYETLAQKVHAALDQLRAKA